MGNRVVALVCVTTLVLPSAGVAAASPWSSTADAGGRPVAVATDGELCDPSFDGTWEVNGTEYVLCVTPETRVDGSIVGLKDVGDYVRTDERVVVPSADGLPESSYDALETGSLGETTLHAIRRTTLDVDWNLTVEGTYRRGFADGEELYLTTDTHLYSVARETGEVVWEKELAAEPVGDERHLVGVDKVDNLLHVELRNGEQPNRYLVVDARTGETVLSSSGDEHIYFAATVPGAAVFLTPDRLVKVDTTTLDVVAETSRVYNDNAVIAEHAASDTFVFATPEHFLFVDVRAFEIHEADVGRPSLVLAHRVDVRDGRFVVPLRDIGSYTRTERFRTDPTGPSVTRTEEAYIRTYSMDGELLDEEHFPESDLEAFRTRVDEEFPAVQHDSMRDGDRILYEDLHYDYRDSAPNRVYTTVDGSRVLVFREIGWNATTEHPLGDHTLNYTSVGGSLRGSVAAETLSIYSPDGRRVYERSMPKYSDFVGYGDHDMLIVTASPDADSVVYDPTVVENEPPAVAEVASVSNGTFEGVSVTVADQSPSDLESIDIHIRPAGSDGDGVVLGDDEARVVLDREGITGFETSSNGLSAPVRTNVTGGSVTILLPYDGDGPANVSVVVEDRQFDATRNETVAFESAATPTSTATDDGTRSATDEADGGPSSPVPFPVGVAGTVLLVVGVALFVSRRRG